MELKTRRRSGSLACSWRSPSRRARMRNDSSRSRRRPRQSSRDSSSTSSRCSRQKPESRCASWRSAQVRRSTSRAAAMRTWCSCTRSPPRSSSSARATACSAFPSCTTTSSSSGRNRTRPESPAGRHDRRIAQDQECGRAVRVAWRPQRHAHRRGQPLDDGGHRHRPGERPVVSRDGARHGPGAQHSLVDERLSPRRSSNLARLQ